ncbi:MAG: hypothetical protein JWQ04_3139 [Pedosphaera sp.]|nr:hypothetical protein [Pedosphaera sp.]
METESGNGHGVTLEKLMSDLKVVIEDGQQFLEGGADQLRQKAISGARAADDDIRRNPYPSMGIIFGLGVMLGILSYSLFQGGIQTYEDERD